MVALKFLGVTYIFWEGEVRFVTPGFGLQVEISECVQKDFYCLEKDPSNWRNVLKYYIYIFFSELLIACCKWAYFSSLFLKVYTMSS